MQHHLAAMEKEMTAQQSNDPDTEPLVSVIMNCFNGEKYLEEAIDSVYDQTYENWEIIFWDNASTDNSAVIAKRYDERLRYFRGEKTVRLGSARKRALEQARGEFISFLDCDDLYLPDKIQKQLMALENNSYALCYGGVIEIEKNGKKMGVRKPRYSNGYLFGNLLNQFDIEIPATMVRKAALENSSLSFDANIAASEEYCLFMQLAVNRKFCVIDDLLAQYRIHDRAFTNRSISKWADEREYTLKMICKKHPGIEEKFKSGFREAYARACYYRARWYIFRGEKRKAISELRKTIFVNYKYFVLFLLALTPNSVWNLAHKVRTARSTFY